MNIKTLLIIILCSLIINSQANISYAQEVSSSAVPTPIEYQLPYPGILPGHPFYFLKNMRDGILSFFISNPFKRAEFDLLQADKNFQAAVYLYEQNKESEVVFETLQKSEDYFADAIVRIQEAKKQGTYVSDFTDKITIANLKHQEMVLGLAKSAKGDDKKRLEVELEKIKKLDDRAKTLISK